MTLSRVISPSVGENSLEPLLLKLHEDYATLNNAIATKKEHLSSFASIQQALSTTASSITSSSWLRRVLVPSLLEYMVGIGSGFAASRFVVPGTNWYLNPLIMSSFFMTINCMLRFPQTEKKACRQALRIIRSIIFSINDMLTRSVLLHEGCHTLAALSLYDHANPRIEIHESLDIINYTGTTYIESSSPTKWGNLLGEKNSRALFSIAGSAGTTVTSFAAMAIAQAIPDDYVEVKTYLRMAVLFTLLTNISYALSAYVSCSNFNDFCALNDEDIISPAVAVFSLVASTLLFQLLISVISQCRHRLHHTKMNQEKNIEEIREEVGEEKIPNPVEITIETDTPVQENSRMEIPALR